MNVSTKNANNNLQNNIKMNNITCSDSAIDRAELMNKIQALAFAKTETELFIDSHPDASAAMEYYRDLVKKLGAVTEQYEAKYGPLTAGSSVGESWQWVKGKWPWQTDSEEEK